MATFPALFDTNVLFGFHLNDLVLGLAEHGLYRPLWSDLILTELHDNLIESGIAPERVGRRIDTMRTYFPDACVTGFEALIPGLTCDPKDRHVLAAAVRGHAEVLVTFNGKDFPESSLTGFDVEVVHPDHFLLDQLDLYPGATTGVMRDLITAYARPEMAVDDLLVTLASAGVPGFAERIRAHL